MVYIEDYKGTSLKKNQIPFNTEKDIDRLCFANAIKIFNIDHIYNL